MKKRKFYGFDYVYAIKVFKRDLLLARKLGIKTAVIMREALNHEISKRIAK